MNGRAESGMAEKQKKKGKAAPERGAAFPYKNINKRGMKKKRQKEEGEGSKKGEGKGKRGEEEKRGRGVKQGAELKDVRLKIGRKGKGA